MSKNQFTGTATQPQCNGKLCQINKDQYCIFQAEFAELKHVVGIVTMGRRWLAPIPQFVKSYTLSYSRDLQCQSHIFLLEQDGSHKVFTYYNTSRTHPYINKEATSPYIIYRLNYFCLVFIDV